MSGFSHLVGGRELMGEGPLFSSIDPASGETVWQGRAALEGEVDLAVVAARAAFPAWSSAGFEARRAIIERFAGLLVRHKDALAETIARETGKPLWDALGEAGAMAGKIAISVRAYAERTPDTCSESNGIRQRLVHRPHGVLAVFGPFNFPGHLPNGHIVPALLAGNTVVLKPSELAPLVAAKVALLWREAGLPDGVLNLVQGGRETGMALSAHGGIDGILFTGSNATGRALHRQMAGQVGKILALETGGNNPLVAWDVADKAAAASLVVQSAYVSAGQRCTCARRLIVERGGEGDALLDEIAGLIDRMRIGAWNDTPEPFMGPLISAAAAEAVLDGCAALLEAGAIALRPPIRLERGDAFLTPGLIDVTELANRPDEEMFGPALQVIRVADFVAALEEANATRYGLAAGLISDDAGLWQRFHNAARAGIVNWNRPLTGASSAAPFGGIKESGNLRPSAFYAADYCAWPMAGLEDAADRVTACSLPPGFESA